MIRLALLAMVVCCAGCFGPFRQTGGPDSGKAYRWPGELDAARTIVLQSADDQAKGMDPPAVCASIAVRKAGDQLERASIIWRDETLPNNYNNGADLQRNEQSRMSWLDNRKRELGNEAAKRIGEQRATPSPAPAPR